jgi:hypothetical protein
MVEMTGKLDEYANGDETNDYKWKKWQENWMNKQIEMKQMIWYGVNDTKIGWISKLRWNKWLDMLEITMKFDT